MKIEEIKVGNIYLYCGDMVECIKKTDDYVHIMHLFNESSEVNVVIRIVLPKSIHKCPAELDSNNSLKVTLTEKQRSLLKTVIERSKTVPPLIVDFDHTPWRPIDYMGMRVFHNIPQIVTIKPKREYVGVMVDIETLGLRSDAVITQIAMVPFTKDGKVAKKEDRLNLRISIPASIKNGLTIDSGTIKWWSDNIDVLKDQLTGECVPKTACHKIGEYVASLGLENAEFWASALIDFQHISNMFERNNQTNPIKHSNQRCLRTLRSLWLSYPENKYANISNHDAETDCVFQIEQLFKYKKEILKSK